ncbi:hypothetical protein LMG33818_000382 [Halomonadaceae bacterium LMG 33818]|uniref:taurine ABC transporter substrate-binding protein n=1 Tax=Cernens ardua TaxID=3402176 RepID=UPI003EDC5511
MRRHLRSTFDTLSHPTHFTNTLPFLQTPISTPTAKNAYSVKATLKRKAVKSASALGLITAALCLQSGLTTDAMAADTLTFGYQTGVDPTKVPQANGEYEKATGQHIVWKKFSSGPSVVAALASGSLQVADLGSSPLAAADSRGLPLVTFLVVGQIGSAEALVVRDGSGVTDPKQLEGKTIATPFVSTSHYSLLAALKHWGVDQQKVHIVNLQPAEIAAAWRRGVIDGAYVWAPALGQIEKTGKVLTDSSQVAQWGAPTFEVWVARKDYAKAHPEVLQELAQVSLNAFANYNHDPAAWNASSPQVADIARLTGASPADIPALLKGTTFPDREQQLSSHYLGGGTARAIKATSQFLYEQKSIPQVLDNYADYVDAQYVKNATATSSDHGETSGQ